MKLTRLWLLDPPRRIWGLTKESIRRNLITPEEPLGVIKVGNLFFDHTSSFFSSSMVSASGSANFISLLCGYMSHKK